MSVKFTHHCMRKIVNTKRKVPFGERCLEKFFISEIIILQIYKLPCLFQILDHRKDV